MKRRLPERANGAYTRIFLRLSTIARRRLFHPRPARWGKTEARDKLNAVTIDRRGDEISSGCAAKCSSPKPPCNFTADRGRLPRFKEIPLCSRLVCHSLLPFSEGVRVRSPRGEGRIFQSTERNNRSRAVASLLSSLLLPPLFALNGVSPGLAGRERRSRK